MDRYLLRYFLAVAELGNFSRAAAQSNVTQPTLSAGIAKLEGLVGARLFDRSNRRVSLTQAGSRFLVRARRIMREFELALEELSGAAKPTALRVGVLSTIPTPELEAVVTRHQALDCGEALEIVDAGERDLLGRLERGRIDLALTLLHPGGRFDSEPLRTERYMLASAAAHPAAAQASVPAEDMAGERMIIRRHCEALAVTSRHFTQAGVRPAFGLKTTSDERALALVRAGLGVTVVPESFRAPGVALTPLADFGAERQVGLIYADSLGEAQRAASPFVRLVREQFGRLLHRVERQG